MADMKISNTLVNDTSSGIISYAEQEKDRQINWQVQKFVDWIPASMRTEANKFQDKLNQFFLDHYVEYQKFLNTGGVEGVIDTWHDLEAFLESISDSEAYTLVGMITAMQQITGQLTIRMNEDVPGLMEAVTSNDTLRIGDSYIDPETGIIKIIYNYD
jgi:hypothetical protein